MTALALQSILLGFLFAAFETLVVQWTSLSTTSGLMAVSFLLTGILCTAIAAVSAAPVWLARRSAPRLHFAAAVVAILAFYHVARVRIEDVPATAVLTTLGALVVFAGAVAFYRLGSTQPTSGLPSRRQLLVTHALIAVTGSLWIFLHLWTEARFPLRALLLLAASSALSFRWLSWLFRERGPGFAAWPPLAAAVASIPLLYASVAAASHPLAPGAPRPIVLADPPSRAAASGLPNVVILILDTVRAKNLSVYGYERPTTPVLERFGEHAYTFERAVSNSNWSLASHASILTGLLPHQHGAHTVISAIESRDGKEMATIAHRPLDERWPTLAEALREKGYRTGVSAANYSWFSPEWGMLQGFEYADNRRRVKLGWPPLCEPFLRRPAFRVFSDLYAYHETSRYPADEVLAHAYHWLDGLAGEPFLLVMNFMDAHSPYTSALYAERVPEIVERFRGIEWPAENIRKYDLSIAYLDHQLGKFFDVLKARGAFDDTLIFVTADHGENFAAEGRGWHGAHLFADDVHVPLLVKLPHQAEGDRIAKPAQTIDIVPTILETVGIPLDPEFYGSFLGRRSRAVITESYLAMGGGKKPGGTIPFAEVDSLLPSEWALIDGDRKVIVRSDGQRLLFDQANDPRDARDLAEKDRAAAEREARKLASLLPPGTFESHRIPVPLDEIPDELMEKLKGLGYAQ